MIFCITVYFPDFYKKTTVSCSVNLRRKLVGVFFILSGLMTTITYAQQTMTLSQCVDFALVHNPEIQTARVGEDIAEAEAREIAGQGLPHINAYGFLDDNIRVPASAIPAQLFDQSAPEGTFIAVRFGTQYNATGYLQLDQLIYDGSYWVGLKAAKVSRVYFSAVTKDAVENTIYNVSRAYIQALLAQKQTEIQKATLERIQELVEIVALQYKYGVATKTDRDRLQVDYNNQLTEYRSLLRQAQQAKNALKYAMGMPVTEDIELVNIREKEASDFEIDTMVVASYRDRADYRLLQIQEELRRLDVRRYRSVYQPLLTGYGRFQYQSFRQEFNFLDFNIPWYNSQTIGLRLTIPIFNGFEARYQVKQASLAVRQAELERTRFEQAIDREVSNALADFVTSIENLRDARGNIRLARDVFNVQRLLYKEGVGVYSDFLDAQNALLTAEVNYTNSLLNVYLAKIELANAQGKVNEIITWINQ